MARDKYTSLRLRDDVAPELRRLTRQVAASADRDITQSDAALAAFKFALSHIDEVAGMIVGGAQDALDTTDSEESD